MESKRLCRSNKNYVFFGVCGGIGEYLGLDPTVIRLIWIIFGCAGGTGIVAYIIAALVIPREIKIT